MRIPGLPGASEPTFRTRDRRWMGLDTLVLDTCQRLEDSGEVVSPLAAKAAIQLARHLVVMDEELVGEDLLAAVSFRLRRQRVLLTPTAVGRVLGAYARLVVELDITETCELG
jgi:hypothetical protein